MCKRDKESDGKVVGGSNEEYGATKVHDQGVTG